MEPVAKRPPQAHFDAVDSKERIAPPQPARLWTRTDDYLGALARRRAARRQRQPKPRSQPETPRALLSTIPFLVLITALGLLAVAIMIAAYPGSQPQPHPQPAPRQQGIAAKGWFQEAEKEFR